MRAKPNRTASSVAKWTWLAAGSIGVFLIYFVTINHVNLYPWNNLRSSTAELPSTLVVSRDSIPRLPGSLCAAYSLVNVDRHGA